MTPNEGRQIEDLSAYYGGDSYYFPSNMAVIQEDGTLLAASGVTPEGGATKQNGGEENERTFENN